MGFSWLFQGFFLRRSSSDLSIFYRGFAAVDPLFNMNFLFLVVLYARTIAALIIVKSGNCFHSMPGRFIGRFPDLVRHGSFTLLPCAGRFYHIFLRAICKAGKVRHGVTLCLAPDVCTYYHMGSPHRKTILFSSGGRWGGVIASSY